MKTILSIVSSIALSLTLVLSSLVGFETYMYDYKGSSVVMLTKSTSKQRGGTGFQVLSPSGKQYTLTNAHICSIGKNLVAHDQEGKSHNIKVIKVYKKHDLCIMEPIKSLRPLKIAKKINLHERLWLIGHPALRPLTLESGHFAGSTIIDLMIICGKTPETSYYCLKKMTANYINNIAYGGNSGSPVLNKFGKVVGVLYAGSRSQPTASYIVPLKEIHKFLKDL